MKIGIVGSGNVGGTIGSRWAKAGHAVIFGSRNPESESIQDLLGKSGPTASAAFAAEAVAKSEIILLATPWLGTQKVLEDLGDFGGKTLIDATNPISQDFSGLTHSGNNSGAEMVARWARNSRVVKAFNTIGSNVMANPHFGDESASLFYCGDDKASKATVHELVEELGFEPYDAGPLIQARVLEPHAMLWITLAVKYGYGREIAFKFLQR